MRQILVVDDDPLTRITLTLMLEDANYYVQTAGDGAEALAFIDRSPPDLVLSDIRLPHISGIQLPDLAHLTRCAFLEKPIDFDELLAVVAGLLAPPHRSATLRVSQPAVL
jgi:DNA-binding LytR/AlgR family response regulator